PVPESPDPNFRPKTVVGFCTTLFQRARQRGCMDIPTHIPRSRHAFLSNSNLLTMHILRIINSKSLISKRSRRGGEVSVLEPEYSTLQHVKVNHTQCGSPTPLSFLLWNKSARWPLSSG